MIKTIHEGQEYPKGLFSLFDVVSPCHEQGLCIRIPLWFNITRWLSDRPFTGKAELFFVWVTRFGLCQGDGPPVEEVNMFLWPRRGGGGA